MPDHTTIAISKETRDRLLAIGKKGETYDDIVNRILDDGAGASAGVSART